MILVIIYLFVIILLIDASVVSFSIFCNVDFGSFLLFLGSFDLISILFFDYDVYNPILQGHEFMLVFQFYLYSLQEFDNFFIKFLAINSSYYLIFSFLLSSNSQLYFLFGSACSFQAKFYIP